MKSTQLMLAWRPRSGVASLGVAAHTARAEPVTIKQWVLKTEGYPAFLKFAKAEFKKTHPDVDIVVEDFPNEAYKTTIQVALVGSDPPDVFFNWSGEDAHRLVRDGLALDITDLGKAAGGFATELSRGLAVGLRVRRQVLRRADRRRLEIFLLQQELLRRAQPEAAGDFDELLGLCKKVRADRSEHGAAAARQFRALEAQPLHHDVQRARARRRRHRAGLRPDGVRGPALHRSGLCRGLEQGPRHAEGRLLPGRAERHLARSLARDVLLGAVADDLLRHLVRRDLRRGRLHRLRHVPHAARSRAARAIPNANFLVPEGYMVSAKTKHPKEAVEWASFVVSDDMAAKFAETLKVIPSNAKEVGTITEHDRAVQVDRQGRRHASPRASTCSTCCSRTASPRPISTTASRS